MLSLTRTQVVNFAVAGALVALTATSIPARSDEMTINLGPVGPHQPILASVGGKRVVAFYTPDGGNCAVQAVVWQDENGDEATRVRVSLNPHQIVHIDSVEQKTLNLQCGDHAEMLAVVDNRELVAFGTAK
jgi:hypothetical protein